MTMNFRVPQNMRNCLKS